jgi:hypothetical protein
LRQQWFDMHLSLLLHLFQFFSFQSLFPSTTTFL